MSLILEALRKSEAERRRGQSPDVFSAAPGAPAVRAPAPRVWPLLLLGAMLLASAWLIWRAGSGRDAPPAVPGDAGAGQTEADAPVAAPSPRIIVVPAPAPPPAPAPRNATPPTPAVTVPAPAAQPLPAPLPAPPPAPVEPADPELPPVAILDAATRATLPPLKLTMHVYAEDPARRFAIVDGQRVGEGARLGPAVVAKIRRDGVVIDLDGRRLLLPKP